MGAEVPSLTQQPPEFDEEGSALYYTAKNPAINAGKITHFAMGMFWKASVHSWLKNSTEPRIELGPYSDRIRLWLRDECEFPEHVYLLAAISRPERAQISLNDPYESERRGWRCFVLHVPGLMFITPDDVNDSKRTVATTPLCIQRNRCAVPARRR